MYDFQFASASFSVTLAFRITDMFSHFPQRLHANCEITRSHYELQDLRRAIIIMPIKNVNAQISDAFQVNIIVLNSWSFLQK